MKIFDFFLKYMWKIDGAGAGAGVGAGAGAEVFDKL
jgi:hypothetical protein